ncbi:hypothetical protein MKW98_023387, partial [Papaver atlanticum]
FTHLIPVIFPYPETLNLKSKNHVSETLNLESKTPNSSYQGVNECVESLYKRRFRSGCNSELPPPQMEIDIAYDVGALQRRVCVKAANSYCSSC